MAFFEIEFPTKIAFGAVGGPTFFTQVNEGFSGFEQRNRNWAAVRAKYDISLVMRPIAEYVLLEKFFLVVGGKADGFRFKDFTDFIATGQACSPAAGDGNNKIFQLQNTYAVGGRSYVRTIKKPIMSHQFTGGSQIQDYLGNVLPDTVLMYVAGVIKTQGTDYTVDATTGLVTFTVAPGNGLAVTADFQFHIPVRFDTDEWRGQIDPSDVKSGKTNVSVSGIQLVEVRL